MAKKIKWNSFVPKKTDENGKRIDGTDMMSQNYPNVGTFLAWGVKDGRTVAIVQSKDNIVVPVSIFDTKIKFFDVKDKEE